jgi:para-aminobenzoate synthetase
MEAPRRVLFIDAYDSFSENVVGLIEKSIDADVTMVHMDDKEVQKNLKQVLRLFDAVVVGPGPGHPANPDDIGLIKDLWSLDEDNILPVLGICLGFQSMGLHYGATVQRVTRPRHGIVSKVTYDNEDFFSDVGDLHVTNYHSLHVKLNESSEPHLKPLAWDVDDKVNGKLLMGMRHTSKPFWGVQFHPESICTTVESAEKLVSNWWSLACEWIASKNTRLAVNAQEAAAIKEKDASGPVNSLDGALSGPSAGPSEDTRDVVNGSNAHPATMQILDDLSAPAGGATLQWAKLSAPNVQPHKLCETLRSGGQDEVVLLDSQGHSTGRYSILGLVDQSESPKILYRVADHSLKHGIGEDQAAYSSTQIPSIDAVWPILQEVTDTWAPKNDDLPADTPFWGGFMGYISYEAGLETINVDLPESCIGNIPDINMVFITRSIVIDHATSSVYVQTLRADDKEWIGTAGDAIKELNRAQENAPKEELNQELEEQLKQSTIIKPTEEKYSENIVICQENLSSGDSYELCLTDETKVITPENMDSWELYKKLRRTNAAPFGAYIQLGGVTVTGSSPERFMSWSRPGQVEFRPIKGTVKKTPTTTFEDARAILESSKEQAENLMIVDLIRHDLSSAIGAHNVWVSKLMVIEEYETVWQLVSYINGNLSQGKRGIDVLKASLPPGSMTGAPKKRSCEILTELEQRPRGVYAGVVGYIDVGGSGDFSVVIRTAFKATDDNTYRVGAGGAVTIQSDILGEFKEMETKASAVLSTMTVPQ